MRIEDSLKYYGDIHPISNNRQTLIQFERYCFKKDIIERWKLRTSLRFERDLREACKNNTNLSKKRRM